MGRIEFCAEQCYCTFAGQEGRWMTSDSLKPLISSLEDDGAKFYVYKDKTVGYELGGKHFKIPCKTFKEGDLSLLMWDISHFRDEDFSGVIETPKTVCARCKVYKDQCSCTRSL
jgi:hypothetical protein